MRIYLAGPHMLTRFKNGYQFALSVFDYEGIFSRGKWKEENNNCIMGGENCVKRYLNANISGDSRGGHRDARTIQEVTREQCEYF